MKKVILLAAAAVLASIPGTVAMQYPRASTGGADIKALPPIGRTPLNTLYNQNSNSTGIGIDSQNFSSGTYTSANNQGADDFIVPKGESWRVEEVDAKGTYFNGSGPATSANVYFHHDNSGMPGKPVKGGSFTDLPANEGPGYFTLVLPKAVKLKAGHYWVSVVANLDFSIGGGEWGWVLNSTIHNDPAVWENPGGGFGVGCTTWGTLESCFTYEGDFMFDLKGRK